MPRQMIPALLLLTSCLALVPSAKADVFEYDVQSTVATLHVKFELPMFEQTVLNQTVFSLETWDVPPPFTSFSLSGGSASCSPGGNAGPCWLATDGTHTASAFVSPLFNGPGMFTASLGDIKTTVTITDVPSGPEPSAVLLLSSCLLGVGLVVRTRRFRQRPGA
jgi:hypothetical protein